MKRFAFISLMCLLSAGNIFAQHLRWEVDEDRNYKIPVGPCVWTDIIESDFFSIVREYDVNNILNAEATVALAAAMESMPDTKFEMDAFFGAWDDESLAQLSRFYAFVMTMEYKYQQPITYQFYGCNREYDCGCNEEPKTMPYYKLYKVTNGQRTLIGEILEKPEVSFEDDVLKFIKH